MLVVRGLADDQFVEMRFQIGRTGDWIETRARIAWADRLRTIAGVEFEDLSSDGRILLSHWIPAITNLGATTKTVGPSENTQVTKSGAFSSLDVPAAPLLSPLGDSRSVPPADLGTEPWTKPPVPPSPRISELPPATIFPNPNASRRDKLWLPFVLFVGLILVVGLSVYLHRERTGANEIQSASPAAQPVARSPLPEGGSAPPREPSPVPRVSEKAPSFFLQAGAMKEERNAYALASSIQQQKLPAFVFKGSNSRFYDVLVGPYPDSQTASKVRTQLREQGFQTIIDRARTVAFRRQVSR
jgi:SPOR domain